MDNLSNTKMTAQLVTPEQLSPAFVAACQCTTGRDLLDQELEYLWDDSESGAHSYKIYLGKISRNPIVKSKTTGKYFVLPWSLIIRLAAERGIDQ